MSYYTYITSNPIRTALYTGFTNNLEARLQQHFENRGNPRTFAGKYHCFELVYFEIHSDASRAIAREKELKGWKRAKKDALIQIHNPNFQAIDLHQWLG